MSGVYLGFDAGHGLYTPGKRIPKQFDPNETSEWTMNDWDATNTANILLAEYEDVKIVRLDDTTGKTDVPLNDRTNKANSLKVDAVISFHHNAGGGTGVAVYKYLSQTAGITDTLAEKVYYSMIKYNNNAGNRATPIARADFHMLRETAMPAILIENGFMDNATDVAKILTKEYSLASARGIAEGIAATFGLKKKPVVPPTPPPTEDLYRVRKSWEDAQSQIGAFAILDNAIELCDKNPGYSVFDKDGVKVYPAPKPEGELYRVRKSWEDAASQVGAYSIYENAIAACKSNPGYSVFDSKGNMVFTTLTDELYRVRKTWEDAKSQIGAYSVLDNAIKACESNFGYSAFNNKGIKIYGY